MYGALTGMSKLMVGQKHGQAQLKAWRRSYATRPPQVSSFSSDYPGNDDRYDLVVWEEKNGWWSEDIFHTKDDTIQHDMIKCNVMWYHMIRYTWYCACDLSLRVQGEIYPPFLSLPISSLRSTEVHTKQTRILTLTRTNSNSHWRTRKYTDTHIRSHWRMRSH